MVEIVRAFVVEAEIKDSYRIYTLKLKVPTPLRCLLLNSKCGVVDAAVNEVFLLCLLHLNQNLIARLRLAIYVKDSLPFFCHMTQMLYIQVVQVSDNLPAVEHGIQETDKQFLVDFRTEEFLEGEASIEVYVSFSECCCTHIRLFFCKITANVVILQIFRQFKRFLSLSFTIVYCLLFTVYCLGSGVGGSSPALLGRRGKGKGALLR